MITEIYVIRPLYSGFVNNVFNDRSKTWLVIWTHTKCLENTELQLTGVPFFIKDHRSKERRIKISILK